VRIPKELRFEGKEVSIRRLGDGVLLMPVKASNWPEGYFENIRIDDPHFSLPKGYCTTTSSASSIAKAPTTASSPVIRDP
jgi:hypothetical protein